MKPIVFIPEPIAASGMDLLRKQCICLAPWTSTAEIKAHGDQATQFNAALDRADGIIVRLFKVTSQILKKAEQLKVIAKHGVGTDNIDCQAASERRIPVVYTPEANANAVAEHTLALILALSRQIGPASCALRDGRFAERNQLRGVELAGKTLGVIGLGRIGSIVAKKAFFGLAMTVRGYDPFLPAGSYMGPASIESSLESVFAQADFLTFHAPLTPATRHILNSETLKLLKRDCRIINTSRGALIDEVALASALSTGSLAGAALDVFEEEPLPPGHPLLNVPNTLLTPHIASSTDEALERMSLQAAQGLLDALHGKRPQHVVNPEVFGD